MMVLRDCHHEWAFVESMPGAHAKLKPQKAAYDCLRGLAGTQPLVKGIEERLKYWSKIRCSSLMVDHGSIIMRCWAAQTGHMAAGIFANSYRTVFNGWCTSARFQHHGITDCVWCGAMGGDHQWHYLSCIRWHSFVRNILPRARTPDGEAHAEDLFCFRDSPCLIDVGIRMVINDLCIKTYNIARHRHSTHMDICDMVAARIRHWKNGCCPSYGAILRELGA